MHPTLTALSLALAAATVHAQELLHYRFDGGCGDRVINYAQGSPAPGVGTITSTLPGAPAASWTPGRFGNALKGGTIAGAIQNWVDTGWSPGTVSGSLTWAAWLKMDPAAPTPSLTYLFGNGSTFRAFTGGGGFFLTSGWGGSGTLNTQANVQTLARAGWTHLALVLDGTALTATYYVNGLPEAPLTMSSPVNWTGTAFYVGKHSSTSYPSIFDLDEFVLVGRALSAAEIAALASDARAGVGRYGSGCGGFTLGTANGAPSLGNLSFALTIDSPNPAAYAINFGTTRCAYGSVPLPFDLGSLSATLSGCILEAGGDLGAFGGSKGPGPVQIALAIPPLPALSGATLYLQAPAIDATTSRFALTNAIALGLGR